MSENKKSSEAVILQGVFGFVTAVVAALITALIGGAVSGYISARLVSQELRSQSCDSALALIVENDPTGELIGNETLEAVDLLEVQARLNCSPEVLAVLNDLIETVQANPELQGAISRGEIEVEFRTDPDTGQRGLFLVPREGFRPPANLPELDQPILVVPD